MDTHEKLKVARSVKEEGNDYFKRGKLSEAKLSHSKMLDMLKEEINFAEDDQKKERGLLVLAAHLNFAECSLQLGDYTKVIDHCTAALDMDRYNVKAHFRRAKAFQNQAEYAKALDDYRCVFKLELNNPQAQREEDVCQKHLDSQTDVKQSANEVSRQEPDNTGVIEVEMVYESCEGDFESFYQKCKKNPGHKMFIDVKDFVISHLPPGCQDEELFALVKLQIQLTVLLEVRGSSEQRPGYDPVSGEKYPFSGNRYRKCRHRGSGRVSAVDLREGEELCPCTVCQSSGLLERRWAEIHVVTATHVVYDEMEGRNTVCYFLFDTAAPLKSCPSVCNALKTEGSKVDESILKFISHNQSLVDFLHKVVTLYNVLFSKVSKKYNDGDTVKEEEDILHKLVQSNQHFNEMLSEFSDVLDTLRTTYNGEPATEYEKSFAKQRKTGVPGRLGHLLVDKSEGGSKFELFLKQLSLLYETSCKSQASLQSQVDFCTEAISRGELSVTEERKQELKESDTLLHNLTKAIEKIVIEYGYRLAGEETPPLVVDKYNAAHPLTIIVSHPHGCSKKISIGEITDLSVLARGLLVRFIYSTLTCPGSSGAFVFILGQRAYLQGPPHSCGGSVESGDQQRNMSAYHI